MPATGSAWRPAAPAPRSAPTSNLYLGSGLFDIAASDAAGMRFALATDVGGGSSFSMLRTMAEAYKVAQLLGPVAVAAARVLSGDAGGRPHAWAR